MGDFEVVDTQDQAPKIGKTILSSFLGSLGNTGIAGGVRIDDSITPPETSKPNYTALYIVIAASLGIVFYLIYKRK